MVNAQEYIDKKYPTNEERKKIIELNISNKSLEGVLKIEGFVELKKLDCSLNNLTELYLTDYTNVEYLDCSNNKLLQSINKNREHADVYFYGGKMTYLKLSHCDKLKSLYCFGSKLTILELFNCSELTNVMLNNNYLASLNFLNGLSSEKLKRLCILTNDLPKSDLTPFSRFTNLETLDIGNIRYYEKKIQQGIYNRFYGSLKPLKDLTKLKKLDISNTDIDDGLEYLPKNDLSLFCSADVEPIKKVKVIEELLTKYGSTKRTYYTYYNNFGISLKLWREFNSSAQEWLDKEYPKESEEKINMTTLSISKKELKGGLILKGFIKLEEFHCWKNHLTNLDLSDCSNLTELYCDDNEFSDLYFFKFVGKLEILQMQNNKKLFRQDLRIFAHLKNLKRLNISDCPFEGSLKYLEKLNKLEIINISNTDISEGLEYLSESCQSLYCNSDYGYKSIKIMEELDKSKCLEERNITHSKKVRIFGIIYIGKRNNKYYNLNKWRRDKQNSLTSSLVPLERLYVIRNNIKHFSKKWGKEIELKWYEKKNHLNELSKLRSPEEFSNYQYLSIFQWGSRLAGGVGGILALTGEPKIGGSIAAVSPVIDIITSKIKENFYDKKEKKWNEFLVDADAFLDNYHELLGILKKIAGGKLGKINEALKELKDETDKFLEEYDEDGNKEIEIDELIKKRKTLSTDLEKLKKIVDAVKKLEDKVVDYQKNGSLIEEEKINHPEATEQKNIKKTENDKEKKEIQTVYTTVNIERIENEDNQHQAQIFQEPYGVPNSSKNN